MIYCIIINGCGESGKDTFVNMCKDYAKDMHNLVLNHSTVESPKRIANIVRKYFHEMDHDIIMKTNRYRDMLAEMKSYMEEHYNSGIVDLKAILNTVASVAATDTYVFIHCREPENIDKIKTFLFDHGKTFSQPYFIYTLLIEGHRDPQEFTNLSDQSVAEYEYDYRYENRSTLSDLRDNAVAFMKTISV